MTFQKKFLAAALFAALGLAGTAAHAGLVTHTDVNGLHTFADTNTGRVWLRMPDMFGKNYAAQVSEASSAGFTTASFADVEALWASAPGISWNAMNDLIGGSSSRGLIWGNYADGATHGWAFAFSGTAGHWDHYATGDTSAYSDLGLWAYQTGAGSTVPEPASYALVALALAGVALVKRRRSI